MKRILSMMCCPLCKNKYDQEIDLCIKNDKIYCNNNHVFHIKNNIPDLRIDCEETKAGANNYLDIHSDNYFFNIDMVKNHMESKFLTQSGIENNHINGKNVLLAGCGCGIDLMALDNFDPKLIVAIDFNRIFYKFKKLTFKNNIIFIQADILSLPFKKNRFDLVASSGVLQHTRSPELSFRNLYSVCKNNGITYIGNLYIDSVKNRAISIARLRFQFHKMKYKDALIKLIKFAKYSKYLGKFKLGSLARLFLGKAPFLLNSTLPDFYIPEYRHVFDSYEITEWFKVMGIKNIKHISGDNRCYLIQKNDK